MTPMRINRWGIGNCEAYVCVECKLAVSLEYSRRGNMYLDWNCIDIVSGDDSK